MIVGIVGRPEDIRGEEPFNKRFYVTEHFKEVLEPLDGAIFPIISEKAIDQVAALCDCLILTGSFNNIHPRHYGEDPVAGMTYEDDEYALDTAAIKAFAEQGKPILGICRGIQSINVVFGGTLNQSIPGHLLMDGSKHSLKLTPGSFLKRIYGITTPKVNSYHRQSIKNLAPGFQVSALSPNGIVESIRRGNIIGVQWHPELEGDLNFFKYFLNLCVKGY